jgi:hypothetical protein
MSLDNRTEKLANFFLGSSISQKEKLEKTKLLNDTVSFFNAIDDSMNTYIQNNPNDNEAEVIAKFKEVANSQLARESIEKFNKQMAQLKTDIQQNESGTIATYTDDVLDLSIMLFRTIVPNIFGLLYLIFYEKQRIMKSIITDLQGNKVINPTSVQYFLHIIDQFTEAGLHITYGFLSFLTSDTNRKIIYKIVQLCNIFIGTLLETLELEDENFRENIKMFFESVLTPILDAPLIPPSPKPSIRDLLRMAGKTNETFAVAKEWAKRNRDLFLPSDMPARQRQPIYNEVDLEQGRITPDDLMRSRMDDLRKRVTALSIIQEDTVDIDEEKEEPDAETKVEAKNEETKVEAKNEEAKNEETKVEAKNEETKVEANAEAKNEETKVEANAEENE